MQHSDFSSESNVLQQNTDDGCRRPTVRHQERLQYLVDLLGDSVLNRFSPAVVAMATDGVYSVTQRQESQLRDLAQQVANAEPILSRLGRGTVFMKLVKYYRDSGE